MTQGEVRIFQEGTGHLGPAPLPVGAVKLDITKILANPDCVILTWERDLEDDLVRAKLTLRHPEIRTLMGGENRKEEENVNSHAECQLVNNIDFYVCVCN